MSSRATYPSFYQHVILAQRSAECALRSTDYNTPYTLCLRHNDFIASSLPRFQPTILPANKAGATARQSRKIDARLPKTSPEYSVHLSQMPS